MDNTETPRDYIAVARGSDLVVICVVGAGNMLTAPALAEFAEEQRKHGYRRFVFDLQRCTRLDSTFMGIMVGMASDPGSTSALRPAVKMPAETEATLEALCPEEAAAELGRSLSGDKKPTLGDDSPLSAVNVSRELRSLMEMLGVDKFVKIRGICDLAQLETTFLPEKMLPPSDRRRLILKAHETLVEIDKRNEVQFGAFLKTLSAELSK
jgi:anti-anti-sigma regulatory factor